MNVAVKSPVALVVERLRGTGTPSKAATTEAELRNPTALNVTVEPTGPLVGLKPIAPKAYT